MEVPRGPMCPSCGMPFRMPEDYGTNRDGSRSTEYWFHCFPGGKFLDEGITLQEKIEKNVPFGVRRGMPKEGYSIHLSSPAVIGFPKTGPVAIGGRHSGRGVRGDSYP